MTTKDARHVSPFQIRITTDNHHIGCCPRSIGRQRQVLVTAHGALRTTIALSCTGGMDEVPRGDERSSLTNAQTLDYCDRTKGLPCWLLSATRYQRLDPRSRSETSWHFQRSLTVKKKPTTINPQQRTMTASGLDRHQQQTNCQDTTQTSQTRCSSRALIVSPTMTRDRMTTTLIA